MSCLIHLLYQTDITLHSLLSLHGHITTASTFLDPVLNVVVKRSQHRTESVLLKDLPEALH